MTTLVDHVNSRHVMKSQAQAAAGSSNNSGLVAAAVAKERISCGLLTPSSPDAFLASIELDRARRTQNHPLIGSIALIWEKLSQSDLVVTQPWPDKEREDWTGGRM